MTCRTQGELHTDQIIHSLVERSKGEKQLATGMKDENKMMSVCRSCLDYMPIGECWITTAVSIYDKITIEIRYRVTQKIKSHRHILR